MLSQTDCSKIALYLGYPVTQNAITMVATAAAALPDPVVDLVQSHLNELEKIQASINDSRLGAGQSFRSGSGGTSQYYRGERLAELRQLATQQVHFIAQLLNLLVNRNMFTSTQGGSSYGGRVTRG